MKMKRNIKNKLNSLATILCITIIMWIAISILEIDFKNTTSKDYNRHNAIVLFLELAGSVEK